jgi:hypothetical protein
MVLQENMTHMKQTTLASATLQVQSTSVCKRGNLLADAEWWPWSRMVTFDDCRMWVDRGG